jgi:hypothetical protein
LIPAQVEENPHPLAADGAAPGEAFAARWRIA